VNKKAVLKVDKEKKYLSALNKIKSKPSFEDIVTILKEQLDFFWVGFYFVEDNQLKLGPFQGPPACASLPIEQGVCAACTQQKRTIIVPDVNKFIGHISCNPQAKSEIVVPIFDKTNKVIAVLDVDSVTENDFDDIDEKYLIKILKLHSKR
jgi:GAF domain-containing protein